MSNALDTIASIQSSLKKLPAELLDRLMHGDTTPQHLFLLNTALPQLIPFNRPLGLKITRLTASESEVTMPLKRSTKNHLGSQHACAIATVGEYAAGILLLKNMDPKRQRLVLKTLHIDYHRQGRTALTARCRLGAIAGWDGPLAGATDPLEIPLTTHLFEVPARPNQAAELMAEVKTVWQIKPWDQVRYKMKTRKN